MGLMSKASAVHSKQKQSYKPQKEKPLSKKNVQVKKVSSSLRKKKQDVNDSIRLPSNLPLAVDKEVLAFSENLSKQIVTIHSHKALYLFILNELVKSIGASKVILLTKNHLLPHNEDESISVVDKVPKKMSTNFFQVVDMLGVSTQSLPRDLEFVLKEEDHLILTPLTIQKFLKQIKSSKQLQVLKSLDIQYVLPLYWNNKNQGLILLGKQISGKKFTGVYSTSHIYFMQLITTLTSMNAHRIEVKNSLTKNLDRYTQKDKIMNYSLQILNKIRENNNSQNLIHSFRELLETMYEVRSFSLIAYNDIQNNYFILDQVGLSKKAKNNFCLDRQSLLIRSAFNTDTLGSLISLKNFTAINDIRYCFNKEDLAKMSHCILLPFFLKKNLIFLLMIHSVARDWSQDEIECLESFAKLSVWGIHQILSSEIKTPTSHDSYTPFEKRLHYEYMRCLEEEQSLSLIDLRIKNFTKFKEERIHLKELNDFFEKLLYLLESVLVKNQFYWRISKFHFAIVLPDYSDKKLISLDKSFSKNLPKSIGKKNIPIEYKITKKTTTSLLSNFDEFLKILD